MRLIDSLFKQRGAVWLSSAPKRVYFFVLAVADTTDQMSCPKMLWYSDVSICTLPAEFACATSMRTLESSGTIQRYLPKLHLQFPISSSKPCVLFTFRRKNIVELNLDIKMKQSVDPFSPVHCTGRVSASQPLTDFQQYGVAPFWCRRTVENLLQ